MPPLQSRLWDKERRSGQSVVSVTEAEPRASHCPAPAPAAPGHASLKQPIGRGGGQGASNPARLPAFPAVSRVQQCRRRQAPALTSSPPRLPIAADAVIGT
ncbi:hypothetical protein AAFF_G00268680 [Aldrovandia affinis]|uniref:Uncharacterized protein n=1 Tax=Aldrovandia affinis TaxID=143900 RepID=A0AAD7SS48_9TELE|nr:hypothetical protein AAFF_G00268680 [Aldrovandia affinis]